jgi:DNA-binding NarL/FixJ family response regulator
MKLLIVDDHSMVREGLAALLRQALPGAEVLQAAEGAQGVTLVESHSDLDAVFLDIGLPGKDGLAIAADLGSRRPDLPVIIISASEDPSDVRRALSLGALGYIPKSASPQTLLSALKLVLSGEVYVPTLMLAAKAGAAPRPPRDPVPALTERQAEVLTALCRGLSNREIADALELSEKTVKVHVTAILKALKVSNRTQAIIAARAAGYEGA